MTVRAVLQLLVPLLRDIGLTCEPTPVKGSSATRFPFRSSSVHRSICTQRDGSGGAKTDLP